MGSIQINCINGINGISNETRKELTLYICNIMSKRHNILPTRTSFFISIAWKIAGIQGETFGVAV